MVWWLDRWLFGNGYGLAAPKFDQAFYCLGGRFYTWFGGFGAQLHSIEWTAPPAGTRRRLLGHDFVVFMVSRRGPRVLVSWGLAREPKNYDEIRAIQNLLPKP